MVLLVSLFDTYKFGFVLSLSFLFLLFPPLLSIFYSFFAFFYVKKKQGTDRRTDGPTDTDGRTHPLIEMRGRI